MATAFPAALDSTGTTMPVVTTGVDNLNAGGAKSHDVLHNTLAGAIIALETKVGIGGTVPAPVVTSTTPYTVGATDTFVVQTGTTPTVHLPTTHVAGRQIIVKHRGSGTMTVDVNGGASGIFTTAAVASVSLGVGDSYTFLDDGTYYLVI